MIGIHVSRSHSIYHGNRENPKRYRYWAEYGIIHCRDEMTGIQHSMSVREFLQRLEATKEMAGKNRADNVGFMSVDEQLRLLRFREGGWELVLRAKSQGDPDDFVIRADKQKQRRTSLLIPDSVEWQK